jgi:hypothetical protein
MSKILGKKHRKKIKKSVNHPFVKTLGGVALSVGFFGLFRALNSRYPEMGEFVQYQLRVLEEKLGLSEHQEINPGVA